MSVITDTLRFMMQRRMWPLAIILIAACVAVPKLLASEPEVVPAPPAAAVKGDRASVLATEPIVAPAADADRSGRRRVLGSEKNPFKPKVTPTPIPTPANIAIPVTAPTTTTPAGGTPTTVGGSPAAPVTVPGTTTPNAPKKKYELNELTVRFGGTDTARPPRKDVKRLQALPTNQEPVLIYLGVLDDKKTAVFLVDSGVISQGDGTCRPSRTSCETINIRAGETEFFDVATENEDGTVDEAAAGAQYQLEVIKIRKVKTASAKKAKQSIARVSKKGRQILRARIAGDGPLRYHYNTRTGRLEKLSRKAYKAVVAKAAHAARAHF